MDDALESHLAHIRSSNRDVQGQAFRALVEASDGPIDWAYEVWDDLVRALTHKDNRSRAIAAQLLCNLAKSDPECRMLKDFAALMELTRDERFVTARHCLLSLWKVGAAGPRQKRLMIDRLAGRFADCVSEKNCTLIRFDIVGVFRKLYDLDQDGAVREKALALIEDEEDPRYRKKYARVWKGV